MVTKIIISLFSGRKNPRTGGVILLQLKDRAQLEEFIKQDPFYIHRIADYEIIEFIPGKYHPIFPHLSHNLS